MVIDWGVPNSWEQKLTYPVHTLYTDLMCSCRAVYDDMLTELYATKTLVLFNAEMVRYFVRNSSPEGQRRVRYVHVALTMDAPNWRTKSQQRRVKKAAKTLHSRFPSLRQLSVELMLLENAVDCEQLMNWLGGLFRVFRGLEAFVLKVPMYTGGYATVI